METKIVFTTEDAKFLDESDEFEIIETFDLGDRYAAKVRLRTQSGEEELATLADSDDRIKGVEDSFEGHLLTAPEGEGYVSEEGLATIENISEFHNIRDDNETGAGITVVVMDSGIDPSHQFLKAAPEIRLIDCTGNGHSDTHGHGTAVAGQIHGIAPDAKLVSLRIFGSEGTTSDTVILRAYQWLHRHTDEYDIVNMSWGANEPVRLLDDTHRSLVTKGVRDVVAAGNSGGPGGSPATAQKAFSVGSCTINGDLSLFSSYDPDRGNPEVCAVGQDCKLIRAHGTQMGQPIDNDWTKTSGTSFSAPVMAGLVARFWEAFPDADIDQILESYQLTARDIPGTPEDGAGIADYSNARDHQ